MKKTLLVIVLLFSISLSVFFLGHIALKEYFNQTYYYTPNLINTNIEEANNSRLNDDQIMILNQVIQQNIQSTPQNERITVTLQYLVELSKQTKLPIGSIYSHISTMWGEHYDLR